MKFHPHPIHGLWGAKLAVSYFRGWVLHAEELLGCGFRVSHHQLHKVKFWLVVEKPRHFQFLMRIKLGRMFPRIGVKTTKLHI